MVSHPLRSKWSIDPTLLSHELLVILMHYPLNPTAFVNCDASTTGPPIINRPWCQVDPTKAPAEVFADALFLA